MPKKRSVKKKTECSYYSCKRKTELAACGYCRRYYCEEHIQPKMPSRPPWIDPELEDEWRKLGHPCPAYSEAFKRMTEEQKQREYEAFNNFLGRLRQFPSWPRGADVKLEPISAESSTELPAPIPIEFDGELPRPSPRSELSDMEVIRRLIKKLRYMFGISLRSFLEYVMVSITLLIIFDVLFTGRFDLILTILRAVVITVAYYIIRFIYWKTRYSVPWKWVVIATLIIVIAHIYSTSNYSIIDLIGSLLGVENLTKSPILSAIYNRTNTSVDTFLNLPSGNASLNTSSNLNGDSIKNESLNTDTLGTDLFSTINSYRTEQGAGQLAWNDTIAAVARIYSNNTLLHGKPTYISGTLDYSVQDVIIYTLYSYESCTFNATGSLKFCTQIKHKDALSKISGEWFNKTNTQQILTFKNFTDVGVGVVTNGSYVYITVILTDYQSWFKEEKTKKEWAEWVDSFMSEVNAERAKKGLQPLKKSTELDGIAHSRFSTMMIHPEISHYGAETYNVGEVVFYPAGFTPQDYATNVQNTAPLHWQGLVNPMFSYYGYYIGTGQTVSAIGSCPITEIPGPNINVTEYLQKQGCRTVMTTSIWLVIDMT